MRRDHGKPRPPSGPVKVQKRVHIELGQELHAEVTARARRADKSLQATVRDLLEVALTVDKKDEIPPRGGRVK